MNLSGLRAAIASEHSLGIDDGAGCTLRVVKGQVWITVEGHLRDIIANAGDTIALGQTARTYVSAFRDAVVLVMPIGDTRDVTFEMRETYGLRTLSIGVHRSIFATAAAMAAKVWAAAAGALVDSAQRRAPAPRAAY